MNSELQKIEDYCVDDAAMDAFDRRLTEAFTCEESSEEPSEKPSEEPSEEQVHIETTEQLDARMLDAWNAVDPDPVSTQAYVTKLMGMLNARK